MTPPGGTPEPFEKAEAMGKAAVFIASQPPQSFTGNILSTKRWSGSISCNLQSNDHHPHCSIKESHSEH
jgi:hypothetical protein